ncbi:MAG: ATP-dependent DNA helicase RecQ [Lachnospiraceae bacterium]|nr:ATP-dependent DNA helicase RecQ [Lachnospiraceae bacterium]
MIEFEVHECVENIINGNKCNSISSFDNLKINGLEQYVLLTAKRLCNIWFFYLKGTATQIDFECALRNYLLVIKKDIVIQNYQPSERFEEFGLQMNKDNGKIWATLFLPDFCNSFLVKQLYMQDIEEERVAASHNLITNSYIRELTGFKSFKSNEQKLAVTGALRTPEGYTTLVSMTTGGGKSLITQTVSYQGDGLTLVIVPTISLMMDQYSNAKNIIKSNTDEEIFYYHSDSDLKAFFKALSNKTARLLFVSPESLIKNPQLKAKILEANKEKYLKNLIIDEAHIIIEWGSSFRIDFQCLDAMRKNFMAENPELRTYLLSATYSDDTIRQLKMFYGNDDKWIEIRCERLRHETRFDVVRCDNYGEKTRRLFQAIDLLPRPAIVYVKSPDDADNLYNRLLERGYKNISTFTGSTDNNKRQRIINSWKNNEFDLMIATCAFGVGVDKKDVRTVIHTYIPETPNKYYQEAGRGGRDGLPSLSSIIYTNDDVDSAFTFVSKVITTEKLIGRWFSMINSHRTQSLLNSKYLIDTYVKPDYNTSEEFIDSISNQDVNWNVYVILFLRRTGLISIDEIQYDDNKYIFYITLINRQLLANDSKTQQMIEKLRDEEWQRTEAEFLLMKKYLNRVGKECWSNMFTKVYRKTHDFCAGCNEHNDLIDFEDSKTLKMSVREPLIKPGTKVDEFLYGAKCRLIISTKEEISHYIKEYADVFVADNELIDIESSNNAISRSLLFCNYFDFTELIAESLFFVSGCVVIYIPENQSIQKRMINIIDNSMKKSDIRFLIISEKDYYLPFRNKNLYELFN